MASLLYCGLLHKVAEVNTLFPFVKRDNGIFMSDRYAYRLMFAICSFVLHMAIYIYI